MSNSITELISFDIYIYIYIYIASPLFVYKVGKINVCDSQSDFYIICWKNPDEDYPKIVETLGIKLNIYLVLSISVYSHL